LSSPSSSFVAWIWPLSNSSIEGKLDMAEGRGSMDARQQTNLFIFELGP
jgi:hypothetical protein